MSLFVTAQTDRIFLAIVGTGYIVHSVTGPSASLLATYQTRLRTELFDFLKV